MMEKLKEYGIKDVKGYIDVDSTTNRTAHPKIFAGGDCVRSHGEASTVMAVQDGKIAAKGIYKQLIGDDLDEPEKKLCCSVGHASAHSQLNFNLPLRTN